MFFGSNPVSAFKVVFDPQIWLKQRSLNLRGFNQEHGSRVRDCIEIILGLYRDSARDHTTDYIRAILGL